MLSYQLPLYDFSIKHFKQKPHIKRVYLQGILPAYYFVADYNPEIDSLVADNCSAEQRFDVKQHSCFKQVDNNHQNYSAVALE